MLRKGLVLMSESKELMMALGLFDFMGAIEGIESEFGRGESPILWAGDSLESGALYRVRVANELQLNSLLLKASTKPVILSTIPDQNLNSEYSYFFNHLDSVKMIVEAHIESGDLLFVVTPALSLRGRGSTLSEALESLRSFAYSKRGTGVVFVLVDFDMNEGKSENRNNINRYCLGTLY